MNCRNCGESIRWNESMGWIHGQLGSGKWNAYCDETQTTEAEHDEARA